jgi:orotidine-5'-phosphate decarboxylase
VSVEGHAETTERPAIAFALDFPTIAAARPVAAKVADSVAMLKVGLELFIAEGSESLSLGRDLGVPIFLDLKLHDIPETVERAVGRVSSLGARLVTVHASGGPAMLTRAVQRAKSDGGQTDIVAVTVLTSLDEGDLSRIGFSQPPHAAAITLARMAADCGVTHFVCSPHEASALRAALGPSATLITPGIRPGGDGAGDQKRVMTAAQAIGAGANMLVVGRPIRDAADPRGVALSLAREIKEARSA